MSHGDGRNVTAGKKIQSMRCMRSFEIDVLKRC